MVVPFVAVLLLQGKPIAVPSRAMTLDAMMKELTAKTGEPHQASERMGGRVVLSFGPARPASTIRADLAAATWGAWRHAGSTWILEEDLEGVRARDGARVDRRVASVVRSQTALASQSETPFDATTARALRNKLYKADSKGSDDNEAYTRFDALKKELPSMRALRSVILSFKPQDLAALPDGRFVFSDRPTRLQRALPEGASAALDGLVRDQNVWAGVYTDDPNLRERSQGMLTMDPRNYDAPIAPGSLRLVLKTNVTRYGIRFEAWFVDKELRVRQFAETEIDATSSPLMTTAPVADPKDLPLPLAGEADAYAAALAGKGTPAMRAKLLSPDRYEPLDFYAAEVCRAIGRARGKAVTIWLDDNLDAFAFDTFHRASKTRPNTASEWIRQLWIRAFNANERSDAIVFRPRGAATNIDRARMGSFLRAVDAAGWVPLDDAADYAAVLPTDSDGLPMLASTTLKSVVPGAESALQGTDWKTLRLWGAFTRDQRLAFRKGATVPLSSLNPDLRAQFLSAIVNADSYEIQQQEEKPTEELGLEREPTELLGNGFRTDGALGVVFEASPGVLARSETNDPEEPWGTGYAGAWQLANATVDRERKPGDKHYDGLPQTLPRTYVPGTILTFGFSVPLSPTILWWKDSQYGEFDLRAAGRPLSDMPESFTKEYQQALRSMRDSQRNP